MSNLRICVLLSLLLAAAAVPTFAAERYVVLDGTQSKAVVFDGADNTEIATIATGATPNSMVISPNGRLAFVANLNSEYISAIDLTIQAEIKRIRRVRADQLAISADGRLLVATDIDDEAVTFIDTATLAITRQLSLNGMAGDDPNSFDLFFNEPVIFGNKLFLNTSAEIVSVDLTNFAVTPLSGPEDFFFFQSAENLAVTPDGKALLAIRSGGLAVIDPASGTRVTTLPFFFPFAVTAAADPTTPGRMLGYVGDFNPLNGRAVLKVIDATLNSANLGATLAQISLPGIPVSQSSLITVDPAGTRIFVSGSNANPNVVILDTAAVLTNPATAIVHQALVSLQARGIAVGDTQIQPPATAPVVTAVDEPNLKNKHDHVLHIEGSGFAPGAAVRIGTLDVLSADFVSSSELVVRVPQNSPSQTASIIVTNPNSDQPVTSQNQSGILLNALTIASSEVVGSVEAVVTDLGDSTVTVIPRINGEAQTTNIGTGPRPTGVAITPDGARAYISNVFPPAAVDVLNFATGSIEAHIVINRDAVSRVGQAKGLVFATRLATGSQALYVLASKRRNLDLYIIDTDPSSPTFNTVVDDFTTNITTASVTPAALAVTSDGKFAFADELDNLNGANLVVIDLATRVVTKIPMVSLGASTFQPTMELSSDGRLLLLGADDGSLLLFDVSHAASPTFTATIRGTAPAGGTTPFLTFPKIQGDRLFSFDIGQNLVDIFNFSPATGNFDEIANFTFPGPAAVIESGGNVTPDGTLIYATVREEDAIAVLDVAKAIAHDPDALITKIGTGVSPTSLAFRAVAKKP